MTVILKRPERYNTPTVIDRAEYKHLRLEASRYRALCPTNLDTVMMESGGSCRLVSRAARRQDQLDDGQQ